MCLEVEMPREAAVTGIIKGRAQHFPLSALLAGARAGRSANIGSAGYRFHRAPEWWGLEWRGDLLDADGTAPGDVYFNRVRQVNDEWTWSSPIRVGAA